MTPANLSPEKLARIVPSGLLSLADVDAIFDRGTELLRNNSFFHQIVILLEHRSFRLLSRHQRNGELWKQKLFVCGSCLDERLTTFGLLCFDLRRRVGCNTPVQRAVDADQVPWRGWDIQIEELSILDSSIVSPSVSPTVIGSDSCVMW